MPAASVGVFGILLAMYRQKISGVAISPSVVTHATSGSNSRKVDNQDIHTANASQSRSEVKVGDDKHRTYTVRKFLTLCMRFYPAVSADDLMNNLTPTDDDLNEIIISCQSTKGDSSQL